MLQGAIALEAGGEQTRLATFQALIKKKPNKPKPPQTNHPVDIKGYRAKIKRGSFWHMCAFSQRRIYSQKWHIQAVCKLPASGLASGTAGAAVSLERIYLQEGCTGSCTALLC